MRLYLVFGILKLKSPTHIFDISVKLYFGRSNRDLMLETPLVHDNKSTQRGYVLRSNEQYLYPTGKLHFMAEATSHREQ